MMQDWQTSQQYADGELKSDVPEAGIKGMDK